MDVSTHLVDLILWQVFPGESIDYADAANDIGIVSARKWTTPLTPSMFEQVTQQSSYPEYLLPVVENSVLQVASNGEFVFKVRGVHGKVSVIWNFENPKGGDTHYSIMRGTKADLVIRQQEAQNFRPTLYVVPSEDVDQDVFSQNLNEALQALSSQYQGLTAEETELGWEIIIPDTYREGHEDHFTRVAQQFLQSLETGVLPKWERTNLLTKYYITTQAYAESR